MYILWLENKLLLSLEGDLLCRPSFFCSLIVTIDSFYDKIRDELEEQRKKEGREKGAAEPALLSRVKMDVGSHYSWAEPGRVKRYSMPTDFHIKVVSS